MSVRSREQAVALAESLARPVVRDLLPLDQAEASVAAAIGRSWRLGLLDEGVDAEGLIDIANHILRLNVDIQESKRDQVVAAITRVLRPLIDQRQPIGRLRAEAHDINAEDGSLLTEAMVEEVIVHALYQARAKHQANTPAAKPQWRPRRYRG
jgi:hypothetical protein